MEFRADLRDGISGPAAAGAAALRTEAQAARDLLDSLKKVEGAPRGEAPATKEDAAPPAKRGRGRPKKAKPAEEAAPAADDGRAAFSGNHEDGGESPWLKAAKAANDAGAAGKKAGDLGATGAKEQESALLKVGGAATGALGALLKMGAAAAGVGGAAELTKLALGWKGVASLQMISQRASWDMRRSMMGIDAAPVIRAASRLEQNLSLSTITGRALSDILKRGFGTAFDAVEKFEPVLSGAFQLGVLGALKLEGSLLKIQIAAAPLTVAIEQLMESEAGMAVSSAAGAAGLALIGPAIDGLLTPVTIAAKTFALLGKGINEALALKREWDENSGGQIKTKLKQDLGIESSDEAAERIQKQSRADFEKNQAARPAGKGTGSDLGDGIVEGMRDKEAEVRAGGARLGNVANQGARDAVGAHSPADATIDLGRDLGDGSIVGMDSKRDEVQAAAERSLVPKVGGARAGGGAPAAADAATGSGPMIFNFNFPGITSGKPEDLQKAARDGFGPGLRQLAVMIGLPIPGAP